MGNFANRLGNQYQGIQRNENRMLDENEMNQNGAGNNIVGINVVDFATVKGKATKLELLKVLDLQFKYYTPPARYSEVKLGWQILIS